MSELEKIEEYIKRTKIPQKVHTRNGLCFSEISELVRKNNGSADERFDTIVKAFEYGMAKGYRAGKRAGRG